jgi:hypothetical protein
MTTNITDLVDNFSITRSIDAELSGSLVFDNSDGIYVGDLSGVLEMDKVIQITAGYSSGGDTAVPVFTAQVSGVDLSVNSEDWSFNATVTLLSPFKNFQKMIIHTNAYENETGETVLSSLVGTFMGWPSYDFSACAAKTFKYLRVDGDNLADAILSIAEACKCELFWAGDGTLTAVPFALDFGTVDYEYGITQVANLQIGNNLDITAINTLNLRGVLFSPQHNEELRKTVIAESEYTWYDILNAYAGATTQVAIVFIDFEKGPAINVTWEIVGLSGAETVTALVIKKDRIVLEIQRPLQEQYTNPTFTVRLWGFLYEDPQNQQLQTTVQDVILLDYYKNIPMESDYENKYVERMSELRDVGTYRLRKNFFAFNEVSFKAPHNVGMNPNDVVQLTVPIGVLKVLVRKITVQGDGKGKLVDTVSGWLVSSTVIDFFTANVITNSEEPVIVSGGDKVVTSIFG